MTPDKIHLTLVSPERLVLSDTVDMVVVPGENGEFGVLPKHAALISSLRPGLVTIYRGQEKQYVFVSGGFANVNEETCLVLAEDCELVNNMDLQELTAYAQRLKEEIEIARSEKEIEALKQVRAMTLLKMHLIEKLKH